MSTNAVQLASQAVSIRSEISLLVRYATGRYGKKAREWPTDVTTKLSYLRTQLEFREEEIGAEVAA